MCSQLVWLLNKSRFAKRYLKSVNEISNSKLSAQNKIYIEERFIPMIKAMDIEAKRYCLLYFILQGTTTLGSIFVPALLSSEEKSFFFNSSNIEKLKYEHNLYWTIWGLSIAVTTSNALSKLIDIEKKYILKYINLSEIKKESWSFIQKSGCIYEEYLDKNYDEFIHIFWKRIENIRHNQIRTHFSYNLDTEDV